VNVRLGPSNSSAPDTPWVKAYSENFLELRERCVVTQSSGNRPVIVGIRERANTEGGDIYEGGCWTEEHRAAVAPPRFKEKPLCSIALRLFDFDGQWTALWEHTMGPGLSTPAGASLLILPWQATEDPPVADGFRRGYRRHLPFHE